MANHDIATNTSRRSAQEGSVELFVTIQAYQAIKSVTSSYKVHIAVIPALWFHSEGPLALTGR
jgi:hypothetical protein